MLRTKSLCSGSFVRRNNTFSRALVVLFMSLVFSSASFSADSEWAFHLNEEFEKGYDFSVGVRAGNILYIGGVTAVDESGNEVFGDNPKKQMELIYQRLNKILKAYGATSRNVVSETFYYSIDTNTYIDALDVRSKFYKGVEGPSTSGVKVVEFTSDNILIELKAIAYLGE